MAQKVQIILEDDLDGSEASQTISFALDGTSYEIDLNDKNAAVLRDALATYVGHARKVSGSRRGRRSAHTALVPRYRHGAALACKDLQEVMETCSPRSRPGMSAAGASIRP